MFTLRSFLIDQIENSSCTIQVNGADVVVDQQITAGDVVSLTTIQGFMFDNAPSFSWFDDWNNVDISFDLELLSPTHAEAVYNDELYGGGYSIGVNLVVVIDDTPPVIAPLNNVYLVDSDIVEQVNDNRFRSTFIMDNETVQDYGVYILSLLQLPFEIDSSLVVGPNTVKLGNATLPVSASQLSTDKIVVDLGTIEVAQTEFNSLDFTNVVTTLHLPFTNAINVDIGYVVGEVIGIEYVIDVYTGKATINLTSSKVDGEVFHSVNVDLGVAVPYTSSGNKSQQVFNNSISPIGNNHILAPFIEVVVNDAVLPNGFFTIPIVDEGQLSGETGYITVDNVELEVEALSMEKELIISRLASGVIIK